MRKSFGGRHDLVALGSVVTMVLPFGVAGLWLATSAATSALDLDGGDLARSWQGVVLLSGALAGFGAGLLLGSLLWVRVVGRLLPVHVVRRWMVGSGGGPVRPYAERLVDFLVTPSC